MTVKAVRIVVHGRVQGVWFRAHTEGRARELELVGTVRNLSDGTVEIVAEGGREAIEALTAWAWEGSPMSEVTEVEIEEIPLEGSFEDFSTRY